VQVQAIAAGLEQADPEGRATYAENARAFVAELDALDQAFAAGLTDCARREIVTSHAAFGYLARRYRLTQVPVMGLSPEAEPSPADLAAIVRTARRFKVTHVFFETLVSPRLAETLGREIGATPLPLNPIEGVSSAEAAAGTGYLELMRANLASLRLALGCR
jgi:zinc transport system substrate-binding protein